MTKWILNDIERRAVINFGVIYLLCTFLETALFYVGHRKQARVYSSVYRASMVIRVLWVLVLNAALIALAFYHPRIAMYLYISLPVLSFFFPHIHHIQMVAAHRIKRNADD